MRRPHRLVEHRPGVRFREECGAKLEVTRSAGGAPVPPGRTFCGKCGRSMSEPALQGAAGAPISLRTSLNPREVRPIGSNLHLNYTAVGQVRL